MKCLVYQESSSISLGLLHGADDGNAQREYVGIRFVRRYVFNDVDFGDRRTTEVRRRSLIDAEAAACKRGYNGVDSQSAVDASLACRWQMLYDNKIANITL